MIISIIPLSGKGDSEIPNPFGQSKSSTIKEETSVNETAEVPENGRDGAPQKVVRQTEAHRASGETTTRTMQ